MAPFIGPSKRDVLQLLQRHRQQAEVLPTVTLGKYQPQFIVRMHQQCYELLPLVLDDARATQHAQQKIDEGYYVPEMTWAGLVEGRPIIQERSLDAFITELDSWSGWIQLK